MFNQIHLFFSKLKIDFKQIFGYSKCDYGAEFSVDYEKYWNRRRGGKRFIFSNWQKQRANQTLNIIEPGSTVLDISFGDGSVLRYLQEKKNINEAGVNIDQSVMDKAKNLGIETVSVDINNSNYINSLPEADYITVFEVIQHMPNPETFIYHIRQKARKGLIISVPNSGYYAHRLRFLFGRFPLQWIVHPGEHLRFWTVRDMSFWVDSMGYKIDRMVLYEGLPLLNKLFPKLFAQGIIVYIK